MAGEIFIADKTTLDAVNSKVGTASDTGGTTSAGSIMAKLNKNIADASSMAGIMTSARGGYIDNINTKVNSLASNNSRKGFTAAELITNKKYVMRTVNLPSSTSNQSLINIAGTGYLYLAVISYSGDEYNSKTMEFVATIDNIILCSKKIANPTEAGTTGIVTPYSTLMGADSYILRPTGNSNFKLGSFYMEPPSNTQSTSDAVVYIPKPIRFTNGFKLEGRTSGSYTELCSFMYELD